ncbi:M28 family metallopeptidase [Cohnella lupini]|nr:M28 family peptidase [Cohnella lupini]
MKYKEKSTEAQNVIGVIKGNSSTEEADKHVIYLSAHLDSLGKVNKQVFNGSGDNASGISSLIHLANSLKEFSENNELAADIVFCAFNGEESNRQGSKAFVQSLEGGRHSLNINLDTIGVREGDYLIVGDATSESLSKSLEGFFNDHGIKASLMDGFGSDHISYNEKSIPGVTIGKSEVSNIHSIMDRPDYVDYKQLANITDAIFNFVISQNSGGIDALSNEQSISENAIPETAPQMAEDEITEMHKLTEEIKARLNFKEYGMYEWKSNRNLFVYQDHFKFETVEAAG